MTVPFTLTALDPSTLDAAYRLFHNGSCQYNAALMAMEEAGLPLDLARLALDAPLPPSQGMVVAR